MREVVRYAAERGITVVPEIEMPGHAVAAIAPYPELGNTGMPIEVLTYWGITDHVLGVTDNVLRFFEDIFDEAARATMRVRRSEKRSAVVNPCDYVSAIRK